MRLPPRLVPMPPLCGILLGRVRVAVVVLSLIVAPTLVPPRREIRPCMRRGRNAFVNQIPTPFMAVSKATEPHP